jgi:hypothetical protein
MEKFAAHTFFGIGRILEALIHLDSGKEDGLLATGGAVAQKWLPDLRSKCDAIGLRLSSILIARRLETRRLKIYGGDTVRLIRDR